LGLTRKFKFANLIGTRGIKFKIQTTQVCYPDQRVFQCINESVVYRSFNIPFSFSFRTLARNLDAADQERALLKNELQGLARALSPLKKEVCEVVKKQNSLRDTNNNQSSETANVNETGLDLPNELNRMKEDLSLFNEEKSALEMEQGRLETRLRDVGEEKEDLRSKLRELIQVIFQLFLFLICDFIFLFSCVCQ